MMYNTEKNKIQGWMVDSDLLWLYETAKKMNSIVEIGCWKGRSIHALLSGCKGIVYAVDHFLGSDNCRETAHKEAMTSDIHGIFLDSIGHFDNLEVYKMSSEEASEELKNMMFDMVFIDGNHRYLEVLKDIKLWLPKTKRLICGHDIGAPSVAKAVRETLGEYKTTEKHIWYREIA